MTLYKKLKTITQKTSSTIVYRVDFFISKLFVKLRNKVFTFLFKIFSILGDWWASFIFTLVILFFNVRLGMLILISQLIQVILQKSIKKIFLRERPYIKDRFSIPRLILPPDKFSFPSGHTAGAFVLFFCINSYLPFISWIFLIIAILIGISRIYLGVHYFTDVLFGAILGFVAFQIGTVIVENTYKILNIPKYLNLFEKIFPV